MKKFILKIFFYNFLLKTVFTLLFFFNKNYKINYNLVSKIKSHKTSDTIFIFGSGESINELDSLNLKKIFNHDTFGFNQAYYSSLPFKFYAFEAIEKSDILKDINQFNNIYFKNLFKYFDNNKNLKLIIVKDPKLKFLDLYKFFKNLNRSFIYKSFIEIPADTIEEIESYYDMILQIEKIFPISLQLRFLEKKRSSLIAYLDLFRRAGYKSIQFVGVDLKNSKYFFQSDNYNYPNLYQQIPQSQPDNRIHKTENKKYGSLIFSEILNSYKKKYDIEIEFFNRK